MKSAVMMSRGPTPAGKASGVAKPANWAQTGAAADAIAVARALARAAVRAGIGALVYGGRFMGIALLRCAHAGGGRACRRVLAEPRYKRRRFRFGMGRGLRWGALLKSSGTQREIEVEGEHC